MKKNNKDYKQVTMRLLQTTVFTIDELQDCLTSSSKTDTVVQCIYIARLVIKALRDGKKVLFVDASGNQENMILPSLIQKI